ncbi:MAG: hypothetical protein O2979_08940 [Proteobacteria bacterium]|nr:hypothetical protein [Pseudomonadota bacterium]
MTRALWLALALLAGCAAQAPEGPVTNTGVIVGEPSAPRNRARIHTELATLYYANGSMSVALEELRIAVAADPTYATAHGIFGLVYMELRENDLARQNFQRALGYAPDDPDINHNYGWFLCQIGKEGEAGIALAGAAHRAPPWCARRGNVLRQPAAAPLSGVAGVPVAAARRL